MSDKTYALFNSLTITGRVSHAELATNKGSEFLAVTLLTDLVDDAEQAISVTFNTTNGLMSLFKSGWLPNGRLVTVTGHIASVSELYLNKETGKRAVRKRPLIHLTKAQVFDGGLGPAKKEEFDVVVEKAPAVA
jgi:hypothetical protein